MKYFFFLITVLFTLTILTSCQTVSKKIDNNMVKEEKELNKWLNKTESDLKIAFGQPDQVKFNNTKNRFYVYTTEKLKIKCVRKFEINQENMVVGFSSKNCF